MSKLTARQKDLLIELAKLSADLAPLDGVCASGASLLAKAIADQSEGLDRLWIALDDDLAKGQAAIARAREILVLLKNNAD